MPTQAVIFDRDGVLANFDLKKANDYFIPLISKNVYELGFLWDKWGKTHGFPKTVAEEKIFFIEFWEHLCSQLKVPPEIKTQLLALNYAEFMYAYPEVREVMSTLRQKNIKVGVLSNFSLASLEDSLTTIKLMDLIDYAQSAVSVGIAKPHPDAYLKISKALKVDPVDCLFFDDEKEHIEGAKAIGMQAYLVKRDEPQDDLTHHIVHDLKAVPKLVKG